ncbi:hypothetical protein FB45DRAFT_72422 [Roridomyces roridus]|uniref:Uncharacterized protein n=1 Tax=Roridomyces roridus TaxID=1738132 RepID=A0AAD7BMY2_9AGAR|nr:hypothetical protein FB45DRAFT_72422 [Roridomyces roridus]
MIFAAYSYVHTASHRIYLRRRSLPQIHMSSDLAPVSANFIALVLSTFLYGVVVLLFISDIYFLATRKTLAGRSRPKRHNFTSLVFFGIAILFLLVTAHWVVVIYQHYLTFTQTRSGAAETSYNEPTGPSEVVKVTLFLAVFLLGDSLVIYRLWIIWGRTRRIMIFPVCATLGALGSSPCRFLWYSSSSALIICVATSIGILYFQVGSSIASTTSPWARISQGGTFGLSLALLTRNNVYSTGFIAFRISRSKFGPDSRLMPFLSILVESAALQTLWLAFTAITVLVNSNVLFIALDTFPAIIGVAHLLIHARVGLGWSQDP